MAEFKTDENKVKEVASILKAVLTSFGGELPMNQIDNEYKTVVGSSIPFKEMKHGSLASFLQSIPSEVKLQNRGGKLVVTVVNDENINLILQQVRQQNNSKCKKTVQKKKYTELPTRQLHGSSGMQQMHNARWQNNWSRTPYRTPIIPTKPKTHASQGNPFETSWRAVPPQPQPLFQKPLMQFNPGFKVTISQPPNRGITSPPPPPGFQKGSLQPQPLLGAAATGGHRVVTQQSPVFQPAAITKNKELKGKGAEMEKAIAKKTYKQQLIEAVTELEAVSGRKGDKKMKLQFKTVPCGKKMEWCSVVTIGDMIVSSYPSLTNTQEEAEEVASKKTLEQFPQLAKKKKEAQLPTTTDYSISVPRVKQLLKEKSPNKRFWWDPLRDMYSEAYLERLPENWLTTVMDMTNSGLALDNPCVDKWTVAVMEETQAPPVTIKQQSTQGQQRPPQTPSPSPQNSNTAAPEQMPQLPPINLPTSPTWDVFITCVEEDSTVQLVLVGENYSGLYSEMLTELELHYMEEKNQRAVKEPLKGEVYVASHEDSWLRVKVVEVIGDQVKVKFVDHGDMEPIPLANLYYLEHRFFSLPPQALQCCLAGLEDAPEDVAFQALMESLPMGKTLVARVQRREEPYAIILFDTSTSEDINLNDKVFESLATHLVEPSLPAVGGLAEVYLTHASTDGIIFVQVESKTYKILEDLLKIAKRRTEEMLGEKVQVDLTKLYLARFSEDGEWYRAVPRTSPDPKGKVLMKFVDFGNSEKVLLSNTRDLKKMSPLLAKVPHQALTCCLHNVPTNPDLKWTVQACERLIEMASPDIPLLLKVVSEGTETRPPSVQLFKRLLPQNELVSINDTLGIDTNLFGSEGDSNNNSVEKEVVISQFRQQSSSASGSASQSLPLDSLPAGPDSFPPCSPLSLNDIPDLGSYFDVFVTFAANPYNFAVQPWKMSRTFNDLNENIQNYYNNATNLKNVVAIESGQYCALKHSDDIWYRAKVEMVMEKSVAGVFVDYGDRFCTTMDKVQPLTPAFCKVPCLAIKAELYGIKAANKDWNPEDACRFRELTNNKTLVSVVYKKTVNNAVVFLSLVLIDTSDKVVDFYINQLLVDENRAVFSE